MKIIECPVCSSDKNSSGVSLGDLRSLSLHIAGKARSAGDSLHWIWVREFLPDGDARSYTVNEIDRHIRGHVWTALREEESEQAQETEAEKDIGSNRRSEGKEPYLRAYDYLWEIETNLHHFASVCLASEYGEDLWKAFPSDLQHECLDRAQQDSHKLSLDRYVDFLGLREVFRHEKNKEYFNTAFESLKPAHKDPQSEFHQKLMHVNRIRNNVMHPLKQLVPSDEDLELLEKFLEFVRKFTSSETA